MGQLAKHPARVSVPCTGGSELTWNLARKLGKGPAELAGPELQREPRQSEAEVLVCFQALQLSPLSRFFFSFPLLQSCLCFNRPQVWLELPIQLSSLP